MRIIWILIFVAIHVSTFAQEAPLTIQTHPFLPRSILATGYSGLVLTVEVKQTNSREICQWKYGNTSAVSFYTPTFTCVNRTTNEGIPYPITCFVRNNITTTSLHVTDPLRSDVIIKVRCQQQFGNIREETSINISVSDCFTSAPLVVNSPSAIYNSIGTFSCANNGILFYSNGTQPTSTQTTCLATAKWSGQDGLECWKAPDVSLTGNLSAAAGTTLKWECLYGNILPNGTSSAFLLEGSRVVKPKGEPYFLTTQRTDDRKRLSCQAITPYTEAFNGTGWSREVYLNVQYAPYVRSPTVCEWKATERGICSFSYISNPSSSFVRLMKNGTTILGETSHISVQNRTHTFSYTKDSVSIDDEGLYSLTVHSTVYGTHTMYFFVTVNDFDLNPEVASLVDTTFIAIIAGVAGLVIVVIAVISIILVVKRRRNKADKRRNVEGDQKRPIGHISAANYRLDYENFQHNNVADRRKYDDVIVPPSEVHGHPENDYDEGGYLRISALSSQKENNANSARSTENVQIEEDGKGYLKVNVPGDSKHNKNAAAKREHNPVIEEGPDGYVKANVPGPSMEDTREQTNQNDVNILKNTEVEKDSHGYMKLTEDIEATEDANKSDNTRNHKYATILNATEKETSHRNANIPEAKYEIVMIPKPPNSTKEHYVAMKGFTANRAESQGE